MSPPPGRPTRLSAMLALLAGLFATLIVVLLEVPPLGLQTAAAGMLAVTAGLVRGTTGWLAVGTLALLGAAVVAALVGATPVGVLAVAVFGVLAWDFGEHAIGLGAQLGRAATTRRQEAVHAVTSAFVGGLAVVIAIGVERLPIGGMPLPAFLTAFLASILLVTALRS